MFCQFSICGACEPTCEQTPIFRLRNPWKSTKYQGVCGMGEAFLDPPDHLGESWACSGQGESPFFFEDPSKRRIRPGPTATAAGQHPPPSAKILHVPLFFSTFFDFWASWFVFVSKTPPRRLQDALKNLQDAPKSLQDAPRCLQDTPVGGQKTLIFLVFFKVFDVQGLPGAILARHGLQDDFKSPWNVFHGF